MRILSCVIYIAFVLLVIFIFVENIKTKHNFVNFTIDMDSKTYPIVSRYFKKGLLKTKDEFELELNTIYKVLHKENYSGKPVYTSSSLISYNATYLTFENNETIYVDRIIDIEKGMNSLW